MSIKCILELFAEFFFLPEPTGLYVVGPLKEAMRKVSNFFILIEYIQIQI